MTKDSFWQTGEIVTIISSVLLILGPFLPWVKAGWISYSGLEKDGMFTAIIGLVIVIILLCKKSPKLFIIITGFLSALVSFVDLANAYSIISNYETAMQGNMFAGLVQMQIGSGLYLTFLASIGLIVGGFLINKNEEKSKKKKSNPLTIIGIIVAVIIAIWFIGSSISSTNNSYSNTDYSDDDLSKSYEEPQKPVQYLEIRASAKNWDSDAEVDGLKVSYRPLDINDDLVKVSGHLSYILYYRTYDRNYNAKKGQIAVDASDIQIPVYASDCDYYDCTTHIYITGLDEPGEYGILEVTLTTSDGKTFSATDDFVSMG
jgi:hypothetical protein